MAQKKFVSLGKLSLYTEEMKKLINSGDAKALEDAKEYVDNLKDNYDPAGTAATAKQEANKYTDTEIAKVNEEVAKVKIQADKGVADAKAADDKAVAAQGAVDTLKKYVGTIPEGASATDVVGYIDEKTANIASDATVTALTGRVVQAEKDIDAIEKDHLKAADKTELEGKIANAKTAADAAQSHSEGVASDLVSAKAELENADKAQAQRITALEGKIEDVTGAMHFKDAVESLPEDVSGYKKGDVILVGEKEYVFNGTEFKEFGDVSAEGKRIGALETKMDTAQADITKAKSDIVANTTAISKKAEQTDVDEKVTALEGADSALDVRLKVVEGKFGEGEGNVATQIEAAKQAAIEAAATDATTKADKALSDAKTYVNTEVEKDRTRLVVLEADTHTHKNKELLDTYDQTNADIKDAVAKRHVHENAEVLKGIDAIKVAAWDKVTAKAEQTALQSEIDRAKAKEASLEAAIGEFVECSEEDVKGLFA